MYLVVSTRRGSVSIQSHLKHEMSYNGIVTCASSVVARVSARICFVVICADDGFRTDELKSELFARPEPKGRNVIRTAPLARWLTLRAWTSRRPIFRAAIVAHHNVYYPRQYVLRLNRDPSRKSSQAPITTDFRDCDLCYLGDAAISKLGL